MSRGGKADHAVAAIVVFWALALAMAVALVLMLERRTAEAQRADRDDDEAELGAVIAAQGDAALVEIRREATRLALPMLPPLHDVVRDEGLALREAEMIARDALALSIAAQGDEALLAIREESTRLHLAPLPVPAVEVATAR